LSTRIFLLIMLMDVILERNVLYVIHLAMLKSVLNLLSI